MSQYPPTPPGNLPPGVSAYNAGPYGQPPARTSAAAVVSLVLGILFCIPIFAGLGAIICGIIGIGTTSKPGVTGRGMAVAGLILGILSLLVWTGVGGFVGWAYTQSAPDRAIAKSFITDLNAGNTAAAGAMCTPAVTPLQLDTAAAQIQAYGAVKSITLMGFNISSNNGNTSAVVSGSVIFANGPKSVTMTFTHPLSGNPLIESFNIQ